MCQGIQSSGNAITELTKAVMLISDNNTKTSVVGFKRRDFSISSVGVNGNVRLDNIHLNMTQGASRPGGALDAMIYNGKSFFVVEDSNRSQPQYLYTRAGEFSFSVDGILTDSKRRKIKGYRMVNGQADTSALVDIQLDPNQYNLNDIGIEDDGILTTNYFARKRVLNGDDASVPIPNGEPLFQLALSHFPVPEKLGMVDDVTYKPTSESGLPLGYGVSGDDGGPGASQFGTVAGGFLEEPNIDHTRSVIDMMEMNRLIGLNQSALSTHLRIVQNIISVVDKA